MKLNPDEFPSHDEHLGHDFGKIRRNQLMTVVVLVVIVLAIPVVLNL